MKSIFNSIDGDWTFDDGVAAQMGCTVKSFDPR